MKSVGLATVSAQWAELDHDWQLGLSTEPTPLGGFPEWDWLVLVEGSRWKTSSHCPAQRSGVVSCSLCD